MNRAFITLFLIVVSILANAQINKYGYPFFKYYGISDYDATEQNWAIVKDQRGIIYFGNNDAGVMQYDGKFWRHIPVSNNSIVRSLAADKKGNIFVGAVGEFGQLLPDEKGTLKYVSISKMYNQQKSSFGDVWKTIAADSAVYFCTSNQIFKYNYNTITEIKLKKNSNFSFYVDGHVYVANYREGLLKVNQNYELEDINADVLNEKSVFVFDQVSPSEATVGTLFNGLYSFDLQNNSIKEYPESYTNKYLKENLLYHATISDSINSFATLNGGIIVSEGSEAKEIYGKNAGLPADERVAYVFSSDAKNTPLWAGLNNGIIRIDWHLPFRIMDERNGLKGHILDIERFNGDLYVATSSGTYKLEYSKKQPKFVNINKHETWSLDTYKYPESDMSVLMIGTTKGLFELLKNGKIRSIEDNTINITEGGAYYVFSVWSNNQRNPEELLLGTNEGISILTWQKNHWKQIKNIPTVSKARSMYRFDNKYWVATSFNGIGRFTPDDDSITYLGKKDGVLSKSMNFLYYHNNRLYLICKEGFFQYDTIQEKFVPEKQYNKLCNNTNMGVSSIGFDSDYVYMNMFKGNKQRIRRLKNDGTISLYDTAIFNRLPDVQIDVIYPEKDVVWLGSSKGLLSYKKNSKKQIPNRNFKCFIRSVKLGNDSILFGGDYLNETQLLEQKQRMGEIALKYRMNDISFTYAAAFYEKEDETLYSCKLDGYDKEWSSWSLKTEKEYTNLPSGKYKFQVKARNVYGIESNISVFDMDIESEAGAYDFRILPPWYQTIWAIIGYVIALVFLVYFLVQWRTRALQKEKERLEEIVKERTAEIVEKKEEIEKQRDEIADKNQSITDSIQYASRIQQALLPSKEMLDNAVPDHFVLFKPRDIVSGDYYWMTQIKQKTILVAADCTGHGVPGAFMSMLGMSFFNEIVNKNFTTEAGEILNHLRAHVIEALKQEGDDVKAKDGMDLALYVIDNETKTINFAGANNPLYIIREQTEEEKQAIADGDDSKLPKRPVFNDTHILVEVKADKMPIGIHIKNDPFQTKKVEINTDMQLYTFSDGYVDQFGGPNRRKFMSKAFKKLLMEIHKKPMEEQKEILDKKIMDWIEEGHEIQVDDIVVLGVKITNTRADNP